LLRLLEWVATIRNAVNSRRRAGRTRQLAVLGTGCIGLTTVSAFWVSTSVTGCGPSCGGCFDSSAYCSQEPSDAGTCDTSRGVCKLMEVCRCAGNCDSQVSANCDSADVARCSSNAACKVITVCDYVVDCTKLSQDQCGRQPGCTWNSSYGC